MSGQSIGIILLSVSGFAQADVCRLKFDNGAVLKDVPLAVSSEDMAVGLSNRDSAGRGMLFSWPDEAMRVVWMKDTRIALSVAYLDAEGMVLSVLDLEPMSLEYRWSEKPATDALELSQGEFKRMGIKVGNRLLNRSCR